MTYYNNPILGLESRTTVSDRDRHRRRRRRCRFVVDTHVYGSITDIINRQTNLLTPRTFINTDVKVETYIEIHSCQVIM